MCSMQALQAVTGKPEAANPMLALGEGGSAKLIRMVDGNETRPVSAAMLALGPVRLRDVGDAQAGIVAMAKDLAAQGAIEISQDNNDEMVQ